MDREKAADHAEVFEHFGIPEQDRPEESCYDYAPVFRTTVAGTPSAVKRTRNLPAAAAIARWTRAMADSGIGVVTPLDLPGNPGPVGDRVWVAYPWISGRSYDGSVADIAAAGALLGRMHAHAYERDPELPSFEWPEHDDADVEAEIEDLRRVLTLRAPDIAEAVLARSAPWHRSFMAETLPAIRDGDLPHVAASTDFKANNLVYTANGPILVDPDNADYLPRIIDLAMAALLFHNELPPRLRACSPRPSGRSSQVSTWPGFLSPRQRSSCGPLPCATSSPSGEPGPWSMRTNGMIGRIRTNAISFGTSQQSSLTTCQLSRFH